MKLWKEISLYLLDNSKLSIEKLGVFEVDKMPAHIDSKTKKAIPEKLKINFTAKEKVKTTEDFIKFLEKKLKIDTHSIQIEIVNQVRKAKEILDKGEKIEIPALGYLLKRNNNIDFITQEKYSVAPDYFGMPDATLPDAKDSNKSKKKKKAKTQKVKAPKVKPQKERKTNKTKEPKEKSHKKGAKTLVWLIFAAALIVAGIFLYKPVTEQFSKLTQEDTVKLKKKDSQETTVSSDTVEYSQSEPQDTEQITDNKELLEQFSSKANVELGNGYKKYYLIVNSFAYIKNAQNYKNELIAQGYNAEILNSGNGRYRVTIGGYDKLEDAAKAYKDFIIKNPGKDIWLLINN